MGPGARRSARPIDRAGSVVARRLPGGVEATGIVSSVHQLFYEPAPDPDQPRVALRQPVSAVEKFPADLLQGNGTVLVPGGVEVVLDELVLVVPTAADAARARGAADEGRRTLTIVCPAPCLGTVVPYEGERIRIDLDDDRLTISGRIPRRPGPSPE